MRYPPACQDPELRAVGVGAVRGASAGGETPTGHSSSVKPPPTHPKQESVCPAPTTPCSQATKTLVGQTQEPWLCRVLYVWPLASFPPFCASVSLFCIFFGEQLGRSPGTLPVAQPQRTHHECSCRDSGPAPVYHDCGCGCTI